MGISDSSEPDLLNMEYDKNPPEIISISIESGRVSDPLSSNTIIEIIDESESASITSMDKTKLFSDTPSGQDSDFNAPSYIGTLSTLHMYLSASISLAVSVDEDAFRRIEDSEDKVIWSLSK